MSKLRTSIAMCTYNGAANVLAQLQSFATQTQLPDELVVCDDASTDSTVGIIRDYASHAAFQVRIFVNDRNLGFSANFAQALSKCCGDVIFLSDQDDVWLPSKLEKFVDIFSRDPLVGLAFCDALLVDENLTSLGRTWWQSRRFDRQHQKQLVGVRGAAIILKDPTWMAAGATMAFRAAHRGLVEPIPEGWTHDAWIATIVSAHSRVALVSEPLNLYRQHALQVYGASVSTSTSRLQALARGASVDHFNATVSRYQQLLDRIKVSQNTEHGDFTSLVQAKLVHWRSRLEMRQCSWLRQVFLVLQELLTFRYHRFSQGWKSFALDVWAAIPSLRVRS